MTNDVEFDWLDASRFLRVDRVREDLRSIWRCGVTDDLLEVLREQLIQIFDQLDDPDTGVENLSRFVAATRSPTSLLSLFERDRDALPALLKLFASSQTLADRLIADQETFDLMRASDGQATPRRFLVDELVAELTAVDSPSRAASTIRKFVSREMIRIAYGEFVRELSPDSVGQQLAYVADAVLEASLQFVTRRLVTRRGQPQRIDGQMPVVTAIALGPLGGEELSYGQSLPVLLIYDAIDEKNPSHCEFYDQLVDQLATLLNSNESMALGMHIDLSVVRSLDRASDGPLIRSADAVIRLLEARGHTGQRMDFVKARVAAGDLELGQHFLTQIRPWVFRHFMTRSELIDIRALRHKLERRAEAIKGGSSDVLTDPGGREDIELTVRFLQLLHGGDLAEVRTANTAVAINALERAGCLTHQEANLLSGNYARLCRLQHQLSVMFGRPTGALPHDPEMLRRLAWRLSVRADDGQGDLERFERMLSETFDLNRRMINHLMVDIPVDGDSLGNDELTALETDLILDPSPDPELVTTVLTQHALTDPARAMDDLTELSQESVSFLSPQRCRHFFAAIAPALLRQVAQTPNPDGTLRTLVEVADSIGAKASLWELLGANQPTLELLIRLCASAPYLTGILTNHPGMIDELIDSLLMDRLPSAERLDAQSIELCRGAADIDLILRSFKNSAHLMIGVRDILGKEMIETTHAAISDTAEACVRRIIEYEQTQLAEQYGDPVDQSGQPAELLAIALGKFGGREPNYHSDLDVIFLYSAAGQTKRRVGGRRVTTTNHQFFNQVAGRVIDRINASTAAGRLYELDGRLRPTGDEGRLAVSVDDFLKRFEQGTAPLWQRLAICKARAVSGSRLMRKRTDESIQRAICETTWHGHLVDEIRQLRQRVEETATPDNLKRGTGGTVDAEVIAQMLILKHAADAPQIVKPGTTQSLVELAKAGFLAEEQALTLVNGYRSLRRIEAYLRLMNTPARHELPSDAAALKNLAFLMNETDPAMIIAQCQQARLSNRRIFDQVCESVNS